MCGRSPLPCRLAGASMGVCPSSLHVFCSLGEDLWPCPTESTWGGSVGVWGCGAIAISHQAPNQSITKVRPVSVFSAPSQTCFQWVVDSSRVFPFFPDPVCDIHIQDLKAQPQLGGVSGSTIFCVSAFCNWYVSADFFGLWSSAGTWVVCNRLWSGWDEG